MKTVCIYHSIDLDGWMSAAIVKHWWHTECYNKNKQTSFLKDGDTYIAVLDIIDFIGYNYGQPIPDISEYDKVIMCDISFPKDTMEQLKHKLIWIDHHISAIKDVYGEHKWIRHETDIEGIQDTKFAACELTWQYLFPSESMPEIVRLLGRYDCFGHKNTDEEQQVLEFQYGARQTITNYEEAYQSLCMTDFDSKPTQYVLNILNNGANIYQYLCTEAKQSYKNGFEVILNSGTANINLKFICINKIFNPNSLGIDYHKDGYDGCMCFHMTANKHVAISLYNDNGLVDCSIIAKQYGGGGHAGASGCRMSIDEFNKLIK